MRPLHTIVLGAGMSGLCMGVALKRANIHDFCLVEQSAGLGGTWWDNRYPGAHVDVPAPLYAFSFAPNPHWTRRFAAAPEIQAYMQRVAADHGLLPHLRLGRRITAARFDASNGLWHVDTCASTDGGSVQTLQARFLVCSTGPLSQPRWPDIPGLDSYAGRRLHSARWPADDAAGQLTGLRVGVIGTGSTASQLVPRLVRQTADGGGLHVFQRTANWVLPRPDRRYRAVDHVLARWPPYQRAVRRFWYEVLEWGRRGFDEGTLARRGMLRAAHRHLLRQVPDAALRKRLQPSYPLGCRRIIYSSDYFPALMQPHAELVTDAIVRITPGGIVTADGRERTLDALVCATGFDTVHLLSSLQVTGQDGVTLQDAWSQGPEAFRGVSVAGFPNLFLLLGPNTGTGHTSTLLYIEPQVQHVLTCMQAVQQGGHRWIAVRPQVMRAHNQALQARLQGSVWTQCRSWYRLDEAQGGKVVALWPGFTGEYVRGLAEPLAASYGFG
jgi:cation diffusion facilitator CzcD-associated flavoprotein CzcO